ncbi:unnamed protein product [Zymoseptoria tritici ST99CH_1A5]|uniref:Uncharacterized protein n=1 Tax=Zymoseptoria tritici ST99CH_1A5 TaxID=1276529 RepID=A0A1Y6L7W2_ZYMTR|nr:unnamed protein product [Zymoseptoria tritici ST99CH_1A5]
MATARFRIKEHTLPASHIRDYARGTADDQEAVLHIAIKQYIPIDSTHEDEGDVTVIGAHANGFPKELYEPLWDDLYERLKAQNVKIRSVWIADVSHQGQSGVLNEHKLGNDPSWFDHPRDLFLMVNHFRKHMKRPLIGIGHSAGGNHLINLSLMHPRLFTTLVMIDPVAQRLQATEGSSGIAGASTVRRDRWPSRKDARAAFGRSKFYQAWDPRVFDKWIEHGLRELPTLIHPGSQTAKTTIPVVSADPSTASVTPDKNTETEVTLKTTKHQEVLTFLRANFPTSEYPDPSNNANPITHIDVDPATGPNSPFYRPEPVATHARLPFVRPSVLYLFGGKSDVSTPMLKADKMASTGIGPGGSGGAKKGRVKEVTFQDIGHLIPMEVVGRTADTATEWIVSEIERYRRLEEEHNREWSKVPKQMKPQMDEKYKKMITSNWASELKMGYVQKVSKLAAWTVRALSGLQSSPRLLLSIFFHNDVDTTIIHQRDNEAVQPPISSSYHRTSNMASKNSEQVFTFEQMSCVIAALLEKGSTLSNPTFALMKAVENTKTVSGYEHWFRAAKARAKEINENRANLDTATPLKKTKAAAATTPKSTGGKKRGRKAQAEVADADANGEDEDDNESPSKRSKREDSHKIEEGVKEEPAMD